MAKARKYRIGPGLLTALLLGAGMLQQAVAEETRGRSPEATRAVPPPDSSAVVTGKAARGGARQRSGVAADIRDTAAADNPPRGGATLGRDPGPIDTRITALTRRHPGGQDKTRRPKITIGPTAPVNFHTRLIDARNAIGLAVPRRNTGTIDPQSGHWRPAVPIPGVVPATPSVAAGIATTQSRGVPAATMGRLSVTSLVRLGGPGRAAINGTGLVRPGLAPAAIGGPPRITAGINGSTIRPKR